MNQDNSSLRNLSHQQVVLLKIDSLHLVLPQAEVRALESALDLDVAAPPAGGVGWMLYAGQAWPVYCLSAQLELQSQVAANRRACVLLALTDGYLGLLCEDARVLGSCAAQVFDLPAAMRLQGTPLDGLILHEGRLACVCSANQLARFVLPNSLLELA